MVRLARLVSAAVLGFALVPSAAFAQAVIAGVVKDASGAVLPGVTIEAASPALIEKARSTVSDGTGQYRIVDLRPGSYVVTFTLTGFSTVKREGVELTGTATANVNGELKVGKVEETIIVTGEVPIVDVQSVTSERSMTREVLDTVPTGRTLHNMAVLIPGMIIAGPGGQSALDVGGSSIVLLQQAAIHGGSVADQRVLMDGLPLNTASGNLSGFITNMSSTQEFTIDTSAVSAEDNSGGVRMNVVPREGGNTFRSTVYGDAAGPGLQSVNYTDDLKARGMPAPNPLKSLKVTYTLNPAFGGPLKKDRLWFYAAGNYTRNEDYRAIYPNRNAGDPNAWLYVPDTTGSAAVNDVKLSSLNARVTFQATPKNKVAFYYENQVRCVCPESTAILSPEARRDTRFPKQQFVSVTYTAPLTSRLFVDAAVLDRIENWGFLVAEGNDRSFIRVNDSLTGIQYRGPTEDTFNRNKNSNVRASASLITGTHALKVGFQNQWSSGYSEAHHNPSSTEYIFANGVPNLITLFLDPRQQETQSLDAGLYAQDRWTVKHLTVNAGLRWDYFHSYYPASSLGPVLLAPTRNVSFPEGDGVRWKDVTTRLGGVYDVFGNGRTAVKMSLSKYLGAQATIGPFASGLNPQNRVGVTTTRSWNDLMFPEGDPRRGNFTPDCVMAQITANGECGPMANGTFGQPIFSTSYDTNILNGYGIRNYNWEFATSVQQQLLRRMSVDVGYFRRSYGNFTITDNRATAASDYDQFSIVAPVDPRLPNGGGYTVGPLYNVTPTKFSSTDNMITLASNYGEQVQRWQGVDVNANVRAWQGLTLQGGFSTGSTLTDNCAVRAALPEAGLLNPYCHNQTNYLTQVKALGSYLMPRILVQVSAGIQSSPGPVVAATFNATNAFTQPSLGRPLSGGVPSVSVNLVEPGKLYGERLNQVDMRFGKLFRFAGHSKLSANLDLFNMFNVSTVAIQNNNYSPTTTTWQTPQQIIPGRLVKVSAQFDF